MLPNNNSSKLKPGSGVFVSISRACDFFPLRLIEELNLVPFVYKGIPELHAGKSSNVHVEANADLQKCEIFILVLPLSLRGRIAEMTWGYAEFDLLTRAGMKGLLYLLLVENIPVSNDIPIDFLPPYAAIRKAETIDELTTMLRADLRSLMGDS